MKICDEGTKNFNKQNIFAPKLVKAKFILTVKKYQVFNRHISALQSSNTQSFHNLNGFDRLSSIFFAEEDPLCRDKTSIQCQGLCTLETLSKKNNLHPTKCAMLTMVLLKGSTQLSSFASVVIAIRVLPLFSSIRRPTRIL